MAVARIWVRNESDVAEARRSAREIARSLGFDEAGITEIETAVSELSTNLVSHRATRGEITLAEIANASGNGIEIRSDDLGPGISDVEEAIRGGKSTAGTLGIGLSVAKRAVDEFVLESRLGGPTTVVARKWLRLAEVPRIGFSVYSRPKLGEDFNGDAYFIKRFSSFVVFAVIDVLGHGKNAYPVALKTLDILENHHAEPLARIIEACHRGLKDTRGAAMALCRISGPEKKLEHVSVGNVETRVFGAAQPVHPICFDGTLGMSMERYRVMEYPYDENSTIVMFSDGISGKFDLTPELLALTPQEIASAIMEEYSRTYDDATVLVGR